MKSSFFRRVQTSVDTWQHPTCAGLGFCVRVIYIKIIHNTFVLINNSKHILKQLRFSGNVPPNRPIDVGSNQTISLSFRFRKVIMAIMHLVMSIWLTINIILEIFTPTGMCVMQNTLESQPFLWACTKC